MTGTDELDNSRSCDLGERKLIVHVVRPSEGGIKSHLLTLLSGLPSDRFETVLIGPSNCSLYTEAERHGIEVLALDLRGELDLVKDILALINLRQIVKRLKPSVLHLHGAKAGLVGRLAVARMKRPRVVVTFHSFVLDERVGLLKRCLVRWAEKSLLRFTDRIIAVSNALKRELVVSLGLPSEKIEVVPNGVIFSALKKQKRSGFRVGTVSRLAPQKGLECFINACAMVLRSIPSAEFVIVGDGPLRHKLEELAIGLGIKHKVEFLGFRTDVLELMAGWDVFVLPSIHEAFGITLVEAMSQGVPVVATRVGGIPEIVDGSVTGLLAEPGDAVDLGKKIIMVLENHELAGKLGKSGAEFVKSRFAAERMIERTSELYSDILDWDTTRC